MSDNVIKSSDINKQTDKPAEKKTAAKKAAPKKAAAPKKTDEGTSEPKDGYKLIVFESGTAYNAGEYRFTQDNRIQEVPVDVADSLLKIENFRLPDVLEIEEYLQNKED